jgi:hypothetical protein
MRQYRCFLRAAMAVGGLALAACATDPMRPDAALRPRVVIDNDRVMVGEVTLTRTAVTDAQGNTRALDPKFATLISRVLDAHAMSQKLDVSALLARPCTQRAIQIAKTDAALRDKATAILTEATLKAETLATREPTDVGFMVAFDEVPPEIDCRAISLAIYSLDQQWHRDQLAVELDIALIVAANTVTVLADAGVYGAGLIRLEADQLAVTTDLIALNVLAAFSNMGNCIYGDW